MKKIRLDQAMVEAGLAPDLDMAKRLVMEGRVLYGTERMNSAAQKIADPDKISVKGQKRYVGRGGLKLERAMQLFPISLENKHAMDIGAATGGFTDCMLQNGAEKVYAVDVGYGLLDWKLRSDPRVVVMERTNARYLEAEMLERPCDFASIDVSFISLQLIFPAAVRCLCDGGEIVALVKPQFEAPAESVGEGGIVRDPEVHRAVLRQALQHAEQAGLCSKGLTYSPVKGADGNVEFLLYMKKEAEPALVGEEDIENVLQQAHSHLA